MANSATEDMLSLAVVIGGHPITGFAASGAIRFDQDQPAFGKRNGVGGLGSFFRVIDDSGTLSIDLLPTSDSNDVLNAFLAFAKSRPNGANYAVSVIDTTGRDSLICGSCAITKNPARTWGDGTGINTWDLIGVQWVITTGGRGATPVFDISEVPGIADIPGIRNAA